MSWPPLLFLAAPPALALCPAASQAGGPAPAASVGAPFGEVGAERLGAVETRCGSPEKEWILEVNGGGLVAGDFDGDGLHDLVVVDGSTVARAAAGEPGRPPRLFLQDQDAGLRSAPAGWRMAGGRFGTGGAAADVEGDGDLDLWVTQWGPDRLFYNDAGTGFEEAGASAGLAGERWGTSAAFFDLEGDGDLDLAVVNYLAFDPATVAPRSSGACRWKGQTVPCGPEGLTPEADQLYRNRGDGTFEEVSAEAGFVVRRPGFGLGVTTADLDADGDTDLYVTNDSTPNHLWDNAGDGRLTEVGLRRGVALDANGKEQAGMGIAVGDLDDDGIEDLFCTNFSGESNALYLSAGGRFRERSGPTGVGGPSVPLLGWGTAALDVDLDRDLDLIVLNGHVYPQADAPGTDTGYAQPDRLYRREQDGRFTDEALSEAGTQVSRALTWLDLGADGRPDLVALTLDGPVRVLANRTAPPDAGWLVVRLVDDGAVNRQALGARVWVELAPERPGSGPPRRLLREVRTAGGFQSAVPAEVHFGLGDADVAAVEVRWPGGALQRFEDVQPNRVVTLRRRAAAPPGESEDAPPAGGRGHEER